MLDKIVKQLEDGTGSQCQVIAAKEGYIEIVPFAFTHHFNERKGKMEPIVLIKKFVPEEHQIYVANEITTTYLLDRPTFIFPRLGTRLHYELE